MLDATVAKSSVDLGVKRSKFSWVELTYLALSLILIVEVICLSLIRLNFPDSFDWVEGAMVDQIHRILAGKFIFGPPSLEYLALIYPPLYIYICAGMTAILHDDGFLSARLLSLLCIMGTFYLVGRFAMREDGKLKTGILAAGICAGMVRPTFYFDQMVREDWLFVFLLLWTFYLLRFGKSYWAVVTASVAFCLATLTKQTALMGIPFLALILAYKDIRKGAVFFAVTSALCGLSFLLLNIQTHGWFFYYVFTVPASHVMDSERAAFFLKREMLGILFVPLILSLQTIAIWTIHNEKYKAAFYNVLIMLAFMFCWLPRVKIGGEANNLFPLCVLFSFLGALGFQRLYAVRETRAIAIVMCLGILFAASYFPGPMIPSPLSKVTLGKKINYLQKLPPGPIFAPTVMYLPSLVGRNASAFWGTMIDVLMAEENTGTNELEDAMKTGIQQQKFAAVIIPYNLYLRRYFPMGDLRQYYYWAGQIEDNNSSNQFLNLYLPRDLAKQKQVS